MRTAATDKIMTAAIGIENGESGVVSSDSLISSAPAARGRKSIFESTVSPEWSEIAEGSRTASGEINMTDIFFLTAAESAKTPKAKKRVAKARSNVLVNAKLENVTPSKRAMPSICTLSNRTTDALPGCGKV